MIDATVLIESKDEEDPFIVQPGEFILELQWKKLNSPMILLPALKEEVLFGIGIIIHSTAGFIDAGFEGTITLEITNINHIPVALYPECVCQRFEQMSSKALVPYSQKSAKYQGQILPRKVNSAGSGI